MNIHKLAIFLTLVLFCLRLYKCYHEKEQAFHIKNRIVLVNPSLGDFKSFLQLSENKVIDIEDLGFSLVFYTRAETDFENISDVLREYKYPNVKIITVHDSLGENHLFKNNSCSDLFYRIFKQSDAILFLGGPDFPPSIYNEKTKFLTEITNPYRHYFELSFIYHLLGGSQNPDHQPFLEEDPEFLIVGFCLGMQSMNVATGGTMYQDIPTEIYKLNYVEDVFGLGQDQNHRNYWRDLTADKQLMGNSFHKIRFHKHHHFFDKLISRDNLTPSVYSSHHQAVKDIGQGFQVIATSVDGKVVEIIAHKVYKNVFGVQFHPESYSLYSKGGDEYKVAPNDTILILHSEFLREKKSVHFHRKFWQNFGEFFD